VVTRAALRDTQALGDRVVGEAAAQKPQDLLLTRRQEVRRGGGPRFMPQG
jgi:hypothetical protein